LRICLSASQASTISMLGVHCARAQPVVNTTFEAIHGGFHPGSYAKAVYRLSGEVTLLPDCLDMAL